MEITEYKSYQEYKTELDTELAKTAEGFVRIGYLLKVARDTNILEESGYKSMAEFAQAEYGLSKDIVSRYVAINDKYSEGGYSDRLAEQYQDYGYAKLAEMLTLPPAVAEALHPELTKEEIRTIKAELKEEEQITDLEVMLEQAEQHTPANDSMMQQALLKYLEEDTEAFKAVCKLPDADFNEDKRKKLADILAPNDIAMHMVRVPGVGRLLISIRGRDKDIEVVNSRSGDKKSISWEGLCAVLENILKNTAKQTPEDRYKAIYNHDMPEEKQEVAPAQPHWPAKEIPDKKKKAEKKSKVTVPKKPEKSKKAQQEKQAEEAKSLDSTPCGGDAHKQLEQVTEEIQEEIKPERPEEEQLQGQMEVADYPELLPEGQAEGIGEKPEISANESTHDAVEPQTEIMPYAELVKLWGEIEEARDKVEEFIDDTALCDIVEGDVETETIKKAYHGAASLAAGLEKLMTEIRRREKRNE